MGGGGEDEVMSSELAPGKRWRWGGKSEGERGFCLDRRQRRQARKEGCLKRRPTWRLRAFASSNFEVKNRI